MSQHFVSCFVNIACDYVTSCACCTQRADRLEIQNLCLQYITHMHVRYGKLARLRLDQTCRFFEESSGRFSSGAYVKRSKKSSSSSGRRAAATEPPPKSPTSCLGWQFCCPHRMCRINRAWHQPTKHLFHHSAFFPCIYHLHDCCFHINHLKLHISLHILFQSTLVSRWKQS